MLWLTDCGLVYKVSRITKPALPLKAYEVYRDMFEPRHSVRTSMADYKVDDWSINLPLYAIGEIEGQLKG